MSESNMHHPESHDSHTGARALNGQIDHETLRQGREQLAGVIVNLVETGDPDAMYDYFGDMLGDTEGIADATERAALFELLASEQQSEIKRGLESAGAEMVDRSIIGTVQAKQDISESRPRITGRLAQVMPTYEQAVGRYVRREPNAKRAAIGIEETGSVLRGATTSLSESVDRFELWSRLQTAASRDYLAQMDRGRSHIQALKEARNTLAPGYDGEPKDLTRAIDERVKESAISRMEAIVSDAKEQGIPVETAVMNALNTEPDTSLDIATDYATFAEQNGRTAMIGGNRVGQAFQQTRELAQRFVSRGQEGLLYARRPGELEDAYSRQRASLTSIVQGGELTTRQGMGALVASEQAVSQLKQNVAAKQVGGNA